MQDQPEIELGRETKSTGARFGLLGVAVLAVGAFIWTGFGEGIQQGTSNVVRTVIDKSMQRLGLGQAPNALTEGEWYLSVYYGPDFTDVTPVGLGHPFKVTFTSAPDLSGTYENVAGSGSVSGFERPGQLVMTYSGADGMSHGVAILQNIQTHLSSNNVEHDYVGARFGPRLL
ncbi:hypothetical protein X766_31995 [Mesorhizobium sp. LSJC255A00]|uniref:hypothetical protein n=1 Tax=Mesorhizobium sp. LSJC255A00 TaxID=1287313 RepID=UPI0003CE29EB|nr:hypothetical protein [Mesorhizobium sp. LSJC255A00]ESX11157.1 hypothetical protein X766_31995 [Mesorhizobium sp. LSJC255A00]